MFKAKGASRKEIGDQAEALALAHLERQGLSLVQRNYRVARGPSARGGGLRRPGKCAKVGVRMTASERTFEVSPGLHVAARAHGPDDGAPLLAMPGWLAYWSA